MTTKVRKAKKRDEKAQEFFDPKTGSDRDLWPDIDSPEDDKWAKIIREAYDLDDLIGLTV